MQYWMLIQLSNILKLRRKQMNNFIALIMTATAVWILVAIAYGTLSGWFAIFSFLLFVIAPNITDE